MSNIIFEKNWQDDELIELVIYAVSEYVCAYQTCYLSSKCLNYISNKIANYLNKYKDYI